MNAKVLSTFLSSATLAFVALAAPSAHAYVVDHSLIPSSNKLARDVGYLNFGPFALEAGSSHRINREITSRQIFRDARDLNCRGRRAESYRRYNVALKRNSGRSHFRVNDTYCLYGRGRAMAEDLINGRKRLRVRDGSVPLSENVNVGWRAYNLRRANRGDLGALRGGQYRRLARFQDLRRRPRGIRGFNFPTRLLGDDEASLPPSLVQTGGGTVDNWYPNWRRVARGTSDDNSGVAAYENARDVLRMGDPLDYNRRYYDYKPTTLQSY